MAHQHMQYSMPYMAGPPQYMIPAHAGHATHPHMHQHPHAHAHAHAHVQHAQIPSAVHLVSTAGPIRTSDMPQRKRPKYTRSKTGCLTCRGKKIKCDEAKPSCTRCVNGQRDCVWPEPAPAKKQKNPSRKTSTGEDTTANVESASRSSGSSTSRDATPNSRDQESAQSQSPSLTEERRHSDTMPSYPVYLDHNAPLGRSTQSTSASQTPQGTPPLPLSAGPALPSAYAPMNGNYDFHNGSPNGSASSPSNSRPSTANSAPSAHYSTPSMQAVDARDYPRWDHMAVPRTEAYAAYYA